MSLSYKKWSKRPLSADMDRVLLIRKYFVFKFSEVSLQTDYFISIDESIVNHHTF